MLLSSRPQKLGAAPAAPAKGDKGNGRDKDNKGGRGHGREKPPGQLREPRAPDVTSGQQDGVKPPGRGKGGGGKRGNEGGSQRGTSPGGNNSSTKTPCFFFHCDNNCMRGVSNGASCLYEGRIKTIKNADYIQPSPFSPPYAEPRWRQSHHRTSSQND